MADDRHQIAKESKGFRNRLKKAFRLGSQSTPQSRSNSPSASGLVAPPIVTAPPVDPSTPPIAGLPPVSLSPSVTAPPATVSPPADATPPVSTVTTDLEEAAKLRAKYTHFRILVIGRANAGKTTLLKRVCKTEEDPVYNDVRYQLRLIPHSYRPFTDRLTRPKRC